MRKRYYKSRKESPILGMIVLIIVFIWNFYHSNPKMFTSICIGLVSVGIITLIVFIYFKMKKRRNEEMDKFNYKYSDSKDQVTNVDVANTNDIINEPNKYSSKELMTKAERCFYNTLTETVGSDFIIQPQVNLATIIKKESKFSYQNELYRNIDFGIFNKSNYELLLLIELNDKSHNEYKRKQRDKKVKDICEEAKLPLMTFWLNMPNTKDYISKRIEPFLKVDVLEQPSLQSEN